MLRLSVVHSTSYEDSVPNEVNQCYSTSLQSIKDDPEDLAMYGIVCCYHVDCISYIDLDTYEEITSNNTKRSSASATY